MVNCIVGVDDSFVGVTVGVVEHCILFVLCKAKYNKNKKRKYRCFVVNKGEGCITERFDFTKSYK